MFNVQGKNVVIVGGLNGVGLSLTKTILTKRCNKLYIVDCTENVTLIQELRTQFPTTMINFERLDYLTLKAGEIQNIIQNIVMKMQYIDVFINALECLVEKDLQRTMDINMNLYLNMMMLVRNVMDRNKGGRGGVIVNCLSNLGLQTLGMGSIDFENNHYVQQFLINKQVLLSLTKCFSDEIFFQQTGVSVMCVMPVINQKMIVRNMDWIKKIGLQNLVVDMNLVRGQNTLLGQTTLYGNQDSYDSDTKFFHEQELVNTNQWDRVNYDQDFNTVGNQDLFTLGNQDRYTVGTQDYLNNELVYGQRLGGVSGNIRKFMDLLSFNILRVIERGQNGMTTVVGLGGVKNIQQIGNLSRL